MKLSKIQLKLLRFYNRYQTAPLTLAEVARAFLIPWLLLVLVAGAGAWFIWAGWPAVGWLYIGICVGAFLRDVGRIISLLRTWPLLREIIEWERVGELIDYNEKDVVGK